jgi:hypothetical protein
MLGQGSAIAQAPARTLDRDPAIEQPCSGMLGR